MASTLCSTKQSTTTGMLVKLFNVFVFLFCINLIFLQQTTTNESGEEVAEENQPQPPAAEMLESQVTLEELLQRDVDELNQLQYVADELTGAHVAASANQSSIGGQGQGGPGAAGTSNQPVLVPTGNTGPNGQPQYILATPQPNQQALLMVKPNSNN